MFDEAERRTLLMLLWNWKQEVEAAVSRHEVDDAEAARRNLAQNDVIVRKLGGDPAKPAFGL